MTVAATVAPSASSQVPAAPALTPPAGSSYSALAALLAAASLAGIGWLTLRPLRS